jgi:hypothetical protein
MPVKMGGKNRSISRTARDLIPDGVRSGAVARRHCVAPEIGADREPVAGGRTESHPVAVAAQDAATAGVNGVKRSFPANL